MKKCVYCGKEIIEESKEHIIPNAIGGLYDSTDICCGKCNNGILSKIDNRFTSTFNAIVSNIPNMLKSHNTKSKPGYKGLAVCKGEIYEVVIKDGKVVSCPELAKKEKCNIGKFEFVILGYNFDVDNSSFKPGLCKIAFNYAIDNGIPFDSVSSGVSISKDNNNNIKDIQFKYTIIPFVPLNSLDKYIELETNTELYHNLILFSAGHKLWCYIDLFNTFQYYVLLSDKWDSKEIYKNYMQVVQKIDRTISPEEIYIRRPKDILIYADLYKVPSNIDVDSFKKSIIDKIRFSPNAIDMKEKISEKFSGYLNSKLLKYGTDREKLVEPFNNIRLYFDEKNNLIENNFRTIALIDANSNRVTSYPELVFYHLNSHYINPERYTYAKFERLEKFLFNNDNNDPS